jgi:mannose-6-phosphate isomerase-like protein (cupin superfamily)
VSTEPTPRTTGQPEVPSMVLRPEEIERFDRGNGVATVPFVGKWNCEGNTVTTGMTVFSPGTGIPLHSHNVEESVLVFEGEATAVVGDQEFDLVAGQATWVPAGVPHCFRNRGEGTMTIYWVYGGRDVTRTITATGETFEHLSDSDRGAGPARPGESATPA